MSVTVRVTRDQIADGALDGYATAYLTTEPGYGNPTLDVIEGQEGSGREPALTVPVDPGDVDPDALLAEHGWRAIVVQIEGTPPQPGPWTDTAFGQVATVERWAES